MPPLQKEWAMRCPSAFCLHHDRFHFSQKKSPTQVLSIDVFFLSLLMPSFPFLISTFFLSPPLHHFQIAWISTNDSVRCPRGLWGNVKPKTITVRWWAPTRSERRETLFGSLLSLGPITPLLSYQQPSWNRWAMALIGTHDWSNGARRGPPVKTVGAVLLAIVEIAWTDG